jgi:hypothetical protein
MAPRRISALRACVEIVFIIFLFYSNLLMGEFTVRNGNGRSWASAFADILTVKNFAVALVSSVAGFIVVEYLRSKA